MNSERRVLVTGFGPFNRRLNRHGGRSSAREAAECGSCESEREEFSLINHQVNASWEAVKELYELKDDLRERLNVHLIIDCIPVVYEHVTDKVPQLWKEHDPHIVLHVGVSHKATCLTIENQAHAIGYICEDVNGQCPIEKEESCSSSLVLKTGIDIAKLCRVINDKRAADSCTACVSHDAGRYLCEYIFYQSLCIQPAKTLFIHVPDFNIYPSRLTAKGLYDIIECLVLEGL